MPQSENRSLVSPQALQDLGRTAKSAGIFAVASKFLPPQLRAAATTAATLFGNPKQSFADVLRRPQEFIGNLLGNITGAERLQDFPAGYVPQTPIPPQTPPQSATAVSPAALSSLLPSQTRTSRAVVPTPPAVSPMAPVAPGAGSAPVPTPQPPLGVQRNDPGQNLGALVPQSALLASLARRPGGAPAGYVSTPEALPLGGAPKRKQRAAFNPTGL